jgi:hypothetical protein
MPSAFFEALYRGSTIGKLSIWDKATKLSTHVAPNERDVDELIAQVDHYFGVALRKPGLASDQRGTVGDCVALPGLFLDIDLDDGSSAHAAMNLPKSDDDAIEILSVLPEPTLIVDSGHGWHVYWLFNALAPVTDLLAAQSEAFQRKAIEHARSKGWHLDYTGNLDRVLRVPGTINTKGGLTAPVAWLVADGPRYASAEALLQAAGVPSVPQGDVRKAPRTSELSAEETQPRPDKAAEQTIDAIKSVLSKLKNLESAELMEPVLAGKSFAPAGARDQTLQRIASIVAYLAPDRDPVELAEGLLGASLATFEPDDAGKYTQADRIEWAAEKIERAQWDARRDRAAEERRNSALADVLLKRTVLKNAEASGDRVQVAVAQWDLALAETQAVTEKVPATLEELNAQYAYIKSSKGMVIRIVGQKIHYLTAETFQKDYQNTRIPTGQFVRQKLHKDETKAPELVEKTIELGLAWLKWEKRRTFDEIGLWPPPLKAPPNAFNLWRGFGVKPVQGNWTLMRKHIREIVANNDPTLDQYIVNFIAWMLQNPGSPAEAALSLRSEEGTGKGVLGNALMTIMGSHAIQLSCIDELIGKFNKHLAQAVFVFGDESFWPGGQKAAIGTLKRMITEPRRNIEAKGVDIFEVRNCLHILLATNEDWAIPADKGARRFVATNVSSAQKGNRAYFDALIAELDNGGREAMLYDLLELDLNGWHPRQIVDSAELQRQKDLSLSAPDQWVKDLLEGGVLPGFESNKADKRWRESSQILEHARGFLPRALGDKSVKYLERSLKEIGCVPGKDSASRRGWIFPELGIARGHWDKGRGKVDWEPQDEWKNRDGALSVPADGGSSGGSKARSADGKPKGIGRVAHAADPADPNAQTL